MTKAPESGFSLLEVLVTLAIVSIVSMITFRSLGIQVDQASRVEESTLRAVSGVAEYRLLSSVIEQTVPSWPENESALFRGTRDSIHGTTAARAFGANTGLQHYTIRLAETRNRETSLEVTLGGQTLSASTVSANAAFVYYGQDGTWHESWPPTGLDPTNIEQTVRIGRLPILIRMTTSGQNADENILISLENSGYLPVRASDLITATDR